MAPTPNNPASKDPSFGEGMGYHELFERNPQPMLIYEASSLAIVAANDAATAQYGYSRAEFLGSSVQIIVPPDGVALLMERMARANGGLNQTKGVHHLRKDGSTILVDVTAHSITFGGKSCRLAQMHDVTHAHHLREELGKATALLERASELSRVGGGELDLLTMVPSWSLQTCRIYELEPPVTPSLEGVISMYDSEVQPLIRTVIDRAARDGTGFDLELPATTGRGRAIWVRVQGSTIRENGKPVKLVSAYQDITERKLTEAALRDGEARFRRIVQNAGEGIWEMDAEARTTFVNPKAAEMLGYSEEEMLSLPLTQFMDKEGLKTARQHFENRRQGQSERYDFKLRRKDGTDFWATVASTPVLDAQGDFAGSMAMISDITARKKAEETLRIAATAFNSRQGMFVTNTNWVILQVNGAFTDITGYTREEAVGATPQLLLRSGRHEDSFYENLLETLVATGSWQGEIWDRRKSGEIFPQWLSITAVADEAGQTTHFAHAFTDITARRAEQDQVQRLAFYDPLTGLPNRRLLMDRLKQAMAAGARRQKRGALFFIDLDNFKTLNDTLGHEQGDLLLKQVAQRLTGCIREGDTVARLGGDEFVVMLEDLSPVEMEAASMAEHVGEKIHAALSQVYWFGSHPHHSTSSIGVTLFGNTTESMEEPLKRADLAMYQAKAAGRNALRFFDPQMQAAVTARASLEADLRQALAAKQFLLHYQAQVGHDHRITGVEALVRWLHPHRGMVTPGNFIHLAEDTGLILQLGDWVLESVCRQLATWALEAHTARLSVAVNVSPRQFLQDDFVNRLLAVLERSGANPRRLKLELTEGMLVTNVEEMISKMSLLKRRGISFALDDFGTGYSSLSYLKRLPLDQLKIDQSFVRDVISDPSDAAIANVVITLADSLGLEVIAEGVETLAQRDFLAAHGCLAYQGYLFSRPVPLDEFEALLRKKMMPPSATSDSQQRRAWVQRTHDENTP